MSCARDLRVAQAIFTSCAGGASLVPNEFEVEITGNFLYNVHDDFTCCHAKKEDLLILQSMGLFSKRKEHILYDQKICYRSVV